MSSRRKGMIVFAVGVVLMLGATLLGELHLKPAMNDLGIRGYQAAYGDPGMLRFLLFALGFPLGAGLCVVGAVLLSPRPRTRVAWLVVLTLAGAFASILVPAVFGTQTSPVYFGAGGVLILLLAVAALWYWGHYRARLPEPARPATDLQACGYFWFAVAAWNLCGVGGMPSYALYPEKMIQFGSQFFAVAQMKVVMASLIVGWAFTVLGFRRAAIAGTESRMQEPARPRTRRSKATRQGKRRGE